MTVPVTSAAQRRAEITDAIRRETGIDEAMIERLVRGFYRRVRDDAVIGPGVRGPDRATGSRTSRACARSGRRSR